jgi:hypothetical protein
MKGRLTHIQATAFHEAGHAVMALYVGRQVAWVSVCGKYPGNGLCAHRPGGKPGSYAPWGGRGSAQAAWLESLERIKADMRILLAGPLAEAKALGKPLRALGAKSDLDNALRLGRRLEDLSCMLQLYGPVKRVAGHEILTSLRKETRATLGRPAIWRIVLTLARALQQDHVLDATRIHELIGETASHAELGGFTVPDPYQVMDKSPGIYRYGNVYHMPRRPVACSTWSPPPPYLVPGSTQPRPSPPTMSIRGRRRIRGDHNARPTTPA